MNKKKITDVWVEYDPKAYDSYDALILSKAKKFKAKKTGSGMGFGIRDISFEVPDANVAAFERACRKLKHVVDVRVIED